MADLLGAANRVPGYDSSNNNRALPAAPRQGDTQIQNVVVGRADGRTEQQGADNNLQSGDLRYDSNLQTFLQRLRETPELPELTRSLVLLRSIASSPGLQPGIAQEISQFLEMLQLDADGFPVTVWDDELQDSDGWDAWYNPELAAVLPAAAGL